MGNTQGSILRAMQSRFKAQVKAYLKTKAELDRINEEIDNGGADSALIAEHAAAYGRERVQRGVVRGAAQQLMLLANPPFAKNPDYVHDFEIDYGMPGKRKRPLPGVSPSFSKYMEDNWPNGRVTRG